MGNSTRVLILQMLYCCQNIFLNNKLFKAYQHFQLNVDKMQSIDMNDVKSLKDLWLRKNVSLPFMAPGTFLVPMIILSWSLCNRIASASPFESLQFKAVKIGDINNDALMTNSIDVEFKFGLEDLLLYDGRDTASLLLVRFQVK